MADVFYFEVDLPPELQGNSMHNQVMTALEDASQEIIQTAQKNVRFNLYPGHGELTSNLKGSYDGEYNQTGDSIITILFGTFVRYGKFVEEGTKNMSARAHFNPGIDYTEDELDGIIEKYLDGIMNV